MSRLRSFTLTAAESAEWDAGERRAPRRRAIAESRAHGLVTVEIYSPDGVLLDALVADEMPRSSGPSTGPRKRRTVPLSVQVPPETLARLRAHCDATGEPQGATVARLIATLG